MHGVYGCDVIQVIDVACAAKRAVDQADEADRRCVELTKLQQRAAEQAASVRDLATSLSHTASSVARVALDVCRYHSYQQAFEATLGIMQRPPPIDVETFLSVVDNSKIATAGLTSETAAQRGSAGGLGTCNEVDEMTLSRWSESSNAVLHESNTGGHVCDESTSTDDVAQLTDAVADESPSSFFHSVSVPAMYAQSLSRITLRFMQFCSIVVTNAPYITKILGVVVNSTSATNWIIILTVKRFTLPSARAIPACDWFKSQV